MLLNLINYTALADRKIIDVFQTANTSMPEAEHLFSHVLNAQHIWVKRVIGETPVFDVHQIHYVADFENIHLKNIEHLLNIVHHRDLQEQIIYKNSQGTEFMNVLSDILLHTVNHSTYHRAQIVSQFRLNGINPPSTDYIMFKREGAL
jgi:uncharacterized damage-inducible protein DinB